MDKGKIIIYQTPDGDIQLDVKPENETVWINRQFVLHKQIIMNEETITLIIPVEIVLKS